MGEGQPISKTEQPTRNFDANARLSAERDECWEERGSIKQRVDELIGSAQGRRQHQAVRRFTGDTHSFYLNPRYLRDWLQSICPQLSGGDVTETTATVSLGYPFRSWFLRRLVDTALVNKPFRTVQVEATVRLNHPIRVSYNLILPGNEYPEHKLRVLMGPHIENTAYPNRDGLKATDELLKHTEPFQKNTS